MKEKKGENQKKKIGFCRILECFGQEWGTLCNQTPKIQVEFTWSQEIPGHPPRSHWLGNKGDNSQIQIIFPSPIKILGSLSDLSQPELDFFFLFLELPLI